MGLHSACRARTPRGPHTTPLAVENKTCALILLSCPVVHALALPPLQLPEAFLASLLPRPTESLEAGVASLVQLVSSQYDDVAVNGCSSVAKLAAANESTCLHLATSVPLLQSLVGVVAGDLSLDTLTNAALALAELTSQPAGQEALASKCDGPKVVDLLVSKCSIPVDEEEDVDVVCFKRYWCVPVWPLNIPCCFHHTHTHTLPCLASSCPQQMAVRPDLRPVAFCIVCASLLPPPPSPCAVLPLSQTCACP